MSARIKLNQAELEIIIGNVERNGGDASGLRSLLKAKDAEPSNESHIKNLMEQSTIEEGSGLRCSVCGNGTPLLISDCCQKCFADWALSMRRKNNG